MEIQYLVIIILSFDLGCCIFLVAISFVFSCSSFSSYLVYKFFIKMSSVRHIVLHLLNKLKNIHNVIEKREEGVHLFG